VRKKPTKDWVGAKPRPRKSDSHLQVEGDVEDVEALHLKVDADGRFVVAVEDAVAVPE